MSDATPRWACPSTLRWVAEQFDREAADFESRAEHELAQVAVRDNPGFDAMLQQWAARDHAHARYCSSVSRRLRNRATRQEKRLAQKARP